MDEENTRMVRGETETTVSGTGISPSPVVGRAALDVQLTPVVNFAQQQNGLPLIRSIAVRNESETPLENVEVRVASQGGYVRPASFFISQIPAGGAAELNDVDAQLDAERLASLSERVTSNVVAEAWCGGELLASVTLDVTFLAYDEWQGEACYPELLAAFVTPNCDGIAAVLARAAKYLEEWTGSPSFDAYQTQDPNRALRQAAAIYAAIQELKIVYAVPPAGFELSGTRVRLCDAVLTAKLGSCLDLSLLYASCLEAAGLFPLLLLDRGHAFAGVWLEEMTFQDAVGDDPTRVSKRMAEGIAEIAVVECAGLCTGNAVSFDEARGVAAAKVNGQDSVRMVLDVRRARLAGIRPLPQRAHDGQGCVAAEDPVLRRDLSGVPRELAGRVENAGTEERALDPRDRKIRLWERKLLDLGLRNALINLRLSGKMIPVLAPSLPELEDALFSGRQFTLEPRPSEWRLPEEAAKSFEFPQQQTEMKALLESETQNGRLRSLMGEAELARAVKDLYRLARTALEENGANNLYLSLGLLKWYETDRSQRARYAPLVLLPVEIVRKASNMGYGLRLRDEDAVVNVTLLEMLRQNFGIAVKGLDPLPEDGHGVDMVRVFAILRRAVMQQKRWDVIESAFVGIFSFSRFVMWNDIRNRMADLEKNKVVSSLIEGRMNWNAELMDDSCELDEAGLLLPLPVDASQLFAVKAAVAGETFVLHGPPGTGKSQTITGMIVNLLARGKTVLFVAEKMAALSVVQERLRRLGLEPFCLELHSNKARKKDVLEQLKAASEVARTASSDVYRRKAERAAALRAELSRYPRALHKARACGMSVYSMISAYEPLAEVDDAGIRLNDGAVAVWTESDLERNESLLKSLCAAAVSVGHPARHPLRLVAETEFSRKQRDSLPPLAEALENAAIALRKAASGFAEAARLPMPALRRDYRRMRDIASELVLWKKLPRQWALSENAQSALSGVRDMACHYIAAGEIAGRLTTVYRDTFLEQDGEALRGEWNTISRKWLLARLFAQSGFLRKIGSEARVPLTKDRVHGDLDDLITFRREKNAAQTLWRTYGGTLGPLDRGETTDWAQVERLSAEAIRSAERLDGLCGAEMRRRCAGEPDAAAAAENYLSAWNAHEAARKTLCAVLKTREVPASEPWIDAQLQMCGALRERSDDLRDWILWNGLCAECVDRGLGAVVSAYSNGLDHEAVLPAYRKALLRSLIENAVDADPVLNRFSGAVFDEKVRQLRAVIGEMSELCRSEAYNVLAAKVPGFAREVSQNSELGILQRAIRSGGRNLSIRRLFEQIPNLLPRLVPCLLMSPISAAQYLDPHREMFDCVIFDEASQLTTSKAVGALARGRSAVVVGDPRQLPPTSFFMTESEDEDEDPQLADLTSILDDCLALGMPETHLLWHYRSRHESLIAFSNNQFYENKLYTFPSVNDRVSKVSFVSVAGQFDRGRTRTNRAEAEAVVAEVIRRARDPKRRGESIGIVTLNVGQQNLIDDLFEEARGRDADLERWYQQSPEPLFIKNLENVQGDERDVILFSVGFGADGEGRVSMNFGPINRDGGWRRLNVAVSRSRTEMVVFSSLLPEQIDLSRTSSEGVAALKAFLRYARTGYLPERITPSQAAVNSRTLPCGVADKIRDRLQDAGYSTQTRVGHSKFRVDVGVIDPDRPEEYLLGILLDGENYRDARTVRDREIAQEDVLRGLGWNIARVRAMDWWNDEKRELNRLLERLETLRHERREAREVERAGAEDAVRADGGGAGVPAENVAGLIPPVPERKALEDGETSTLPTAYESPSGTDSSRVGLYRAARLSVKKITAAEFLERGEEKAILSRLERIVEEEAPISVSLLSRRLLQSYGITRRDIARKSALTP